jgi:opacity protein-like surface antigen
MTVKKLALLGMASVATLGMSISIAGGPATSVPVADVSGVYVGVDVGAFYNDTPETLINDHATLTVKRSEKHAPWGWTASGLVGYQFDQNWALQLGYIWNQSQTFEQASTSSITTGIAEKLSSYNWYLAAKGILPLVDAFSAYMLAGAAYTHVEAKITSSGATHVIGTSPTYVTNNKGSWWSPMGALGVSYNFDQSFSMNVQFMYIMNKLSSTTGTSGAGYLKREYRGTERLTLGANYLFAM